MAVNKVIYNGQTLIDITNSTVSPEQLFEGATTKDATGADITGTFTIDEELTTQEELIGQIETIVQRATVEADVAAFLNRSLTNITSFAGTIGHSAFREAGQLTVASFPNATAIDKYGFYNCTSLSLVDMPKMASIGMYAFQNTAITTANFPLAGSVSTYAFYNCRKLVSASFPVLSRFTGSYVFQNCTSLKYVYLPRMTQLSGYDFKGCTSLTAIDLPKCYRVNSGSFQNCSVLDTVILRYGVTVATLVNINAFSGTPIASGTGYIYVPSDLVNSYKSASNWSNYAAQIRAIEDYPDITGG